MKEKDKSKGCKCGNKKNSSCQCDSKKNCNGGSCGCKKEDKAKDSLPKYEPIGPTGFGC